MRSGSKVSTPAVGRRKYAFESEKMSKNIPLKCDSIHCISRCLNMLTVRRFYALKHFSTMTLPHEHAVMNAGNQWAERAQVKVLTGLANISVDNLMAAVLLQDHEVRMGNFTSAFMLTGVTTRMAQALQINLEFSEDIFCYDTISSPSVTDKESRRRLMWCCWAVDVSVGSGVDQLTLLHEQDMKIQLPCDESHFLLQKPCITETLQPGEVLKFAPPEVIPSSPAGNMGMAAYYIRLVQIRKQVVRYVDIWNIRWPPEHFSLGHGSGSL